MNITPYEFDTCMRKLRGIFNEFIEIPAQSMSQVLPILSACEDPDTVSEYTFQGIVYPLPQTGQMRLEHALMTDASLQGVCCQTTSYRNELNPVSERHDLIFPMWEFEARGNFNSLQNFIEKVLEKLGFGHITWISYSDVCAELGVDTIDAKAEEILQKLYGNCVGLMKFPQNSHPFWNMKEVEPGVYNKIDVILYGMETFGTAERSCDPVQMRRDFYAVSNGYYHKLLFRRFGKERVVKELEYYVQLDMRSRFGGGVGITRLVRALKLNNTLGG